MNLRAAVKYMEGVFSSSTLSMFDDIDDQELRMKMAITHLDDADRNLLYIWLHCGTYVNVGKELGVSTVAVRNRIRKIIDKLKKICSEPLD